MEGWTFARLAGLSLILAGLIAFAGFSIHPRALDASAISSGQWATAHTTLLASFLFALLGLSGYVANLARNFGPLAPLALLLTVAGYLANFGPVFFEATYLPALIAERPDMLKTWGDGSEIGALPAIIAAGGAALTIGYVGLGALAIRSYAVPAWTGWGLIVGMLVFAAFVAVFPTNPFFLVVGPLGYLAAHAAAGASLLRLDSAPERSAPMSGKASAQT